MKLAIRFLFGTVMVLFSAMAAYSLDKEITLLQTGDIRFDQWNLEKIVKSKNKLNRYTACELFFQDGTKILLLYGAGGRVRKKLLFREPGKPSEIIYFNSSRIPTRAVFFSYRTRTKTVVFFSRNGNYKRVKDTRL